MIRPLDKVKLKWTNFNIIIVLCDKPTVNIMLNGKKKKAFPLHWE